MTTNIVEMMTKAGKEIETVTEMSYDRPDGLPIRDLFPATHYTTMNINGHNYNVDITITIH